MRIRNFLFDNLYYHAPGAERWFSYGPNKPSIVYHKRFATAVAEGVLTFVATDCICGNDEFDVVTTVDRHKTQQMMVMCTKCGIVMNNPHLNEESYNYFYSSGIYRSRDNKFMKNNPTRNPAGYFSEITSFLNAHDPDIGSRNSVLEIGCNTGETLLKFQETGWEATGLEPYDVACQACESKGLNVICGIIEDFSAEKNYDLIYLTETFEHIYDSEKALEQIRKLLKDDGVLFIRNIGLFNQGTNDVYKFAQIGHPYNYCMDTLKMVVESNGFKLVGGDEFVQGLFRKADIPDVKYPQNPKVVEKVRLRFLQMEAEATSTAGKIQAKKVLLARFLQRIGLYDFSISAKQLITRKKDVNVYNKADI